MSDLSDPVRHAAVVVPSDTVNLPNGAKALWVGGAGTVKVITGGDETVTFTGVLAGTLLPIRCKRVFSTGTSASNIVAMW